MALTPTGSPRTCAQPSTAAWWPRAGRRPGSSSGKGSRRPPWCLRLTNSAQPCPAAPSPGSSTGACGVCLALGCVPSSRGCCPCQPSPLAVPRQVPAVHPGPHKDPQAGRHLHHQQHRQQRCGAAPGLGLHPCQLEDALQPVSTAGGWGHPCLPAPLGGRTVPSLSPLLWLCGTPGSAQFCSPRYGGGSFSFSRLILSVTQRFSSEFELQQVRLDPGRGQGPRDPSLGRAALCQQPLREGFLPLECPGVQEAPVPVAGCWVPAGVVAGTPKGCQSAPGGCWGAPGGC